MFLNLNIFLQLALGPEVLLTQLKYYLRNIFFTARRLSVFQSNVHKSWGSTDTTKRRQMSTSIQLQKNMDSLAAECLDPTISFRGAVWM